MKAFCELSPNGNRIEVFFPYSPDAVEAIKEVPGRRFHDIEREGRKMKFWSVPADLDAARRLRNTFGDGLRLGDGVRQWGIEERRRHTVLDRIQGADDAGLENVRPESAAWLRPYQRADVLHMATANVVNANQPGVGKTVEAIFAIEEGKIEGPHLVICPTSLFKDPWRDELAKHAPNLRVLYGSTPAERRGAINFTYMEWAEGRAGDIILLINPEMVRVQKTLQGEDPPMLDEGLGAYPAPILSRDHKGNAYSPKDPTGEKLFKMEWGAVIADEFHKYGLGADRNTQYARGLAALAKRSKRRFALSGTPTGGKSVRLWGPLNFIEPEIFSGKWKWAEMWLTNAEGGTIVPGAGTGIGDIQPGREEEFNKAHARYVIRRTRATALPGMPPKQVINVSVPMTPKQRKAYDAFITHAEVMVEGGRISGSGILSEYARAKQFANALCRIENGEVTPTEDSGKLPVLLDRLDTYGIRPTDPEPGARAIVASESQRFVVLLERFLAGKLAKCGSVVRRLDGTVKGEARDEVLDWYKEDNPQPRVLVMTTQTGGVGLNLGMTGSIHIMDETWNPDDQEQLEDRGMRNRTTPLICLYYRTEDSIQEYIWEITAGKAITNKKLLDYRERWAKRSAA